MTLCSESATPMSSLDVCESSESEEYASLIEPLFRIACLLCRNQSARLVTTVGFPVSGPVKDYIML